MKRPLALIVISSSLLATVLLSCSSSNTQTDAPPVMKDAKPIDGASHVFMDGPPGTTPLTVMNYEFWCTITVNGGSAMTVGSEVIAVEPGSISLVAKPASGMYEIGPAPWHDTAGDTGSGDPGTQAGSGSNETSTTSVTVGTTPKCVWACCPFSNNGGGCPTTDQCP